MMGYTLMYHVGDGWWIDTMGGQLWSVHHRKFNHLLHNISFSFYRILYHITSERKHVFHFSIIYLVYIVTKFPNQPNITWSKTIRLIMNIKCYLHYILDNATQTILYYITFSGHLVLLWHGTKIRTVFLRGGGLRTKYNFLFLLVLNFFHVTKI